MDDRTLEAEGVSWFAPDQGTSYSRVYQVLVYPEEGSVIMTSVCSQGPLWSSSGRDLGQGYRLRVLVLDFLSQHNSVI